MKHFFAILMVGLFCTSAIGAESITEKDKLEILRLLLCLNPAATEKEIEKDFAYHNGPELLVELNKEGEHFSSMVFFQRSGQKYNRLMGVKPCASHKEVLLAEIARERKRSRGLLAPDSN